MSDVFGVCRGEFSFARKDTPHFSFKPHRCHHHCPPSYLSRTSSYSFFLPMARGSPLSEDLRGVLVFMHVSRCLDAKSISDWTGVPKQTVFRVLSSWKTTGGIKPVTEEKRGRPRALDVADTRVCVRPFFPHKHFVSCFEVCRRYCLALQRQVP